MEKYILDTSLFSNPSTAEQFGATFPEAMTRFVRLAANAPVAFYMPGSVYEELHKIKDLGEIAADFERVVRIRSPRRFSLMVPSDLLYEFIEEVRMRVDRGLRIAEEWTKRAGSGEVIDRGLLITKLRERYREAMRQGIIDSKEDADLLLLAYELDGTLVTADEGLKKWADKVGVALINAHHLRRILESAATSDGATE